MKNESSKIICAHAVAVLALLLPATIVSAASDQSSDEPTLPVLTVRDYYGMKLVDASFPGVPGLILSAWCYESPVDFIDYTEIGGGIIELRHRSKVHPFVIYTTTVVPGEGTVDFYARMEIDEKMNEKGDKTLPEFETVIENEDTPNTLNTTRPHLLATCFQLGLAKNFNAAEEQGGYPGFIDRCFIVTEKGIVIPPEADKCSPPNHLRGDPLRSWVQAYAPTSYTGPEVIKGRHWNYGKSRFTLPIIGTLSHDRKYLVAIAGEDSVRVVQAWHTCLHNDTKWLPLDAKPADRRLHMRVYAMENDSSKLFERYKKDFPGYKGEFPKDSK